MLRAVLAALVALMVAPCAAASYPFVIIPHEEVDTPFYLGDKGGVVDGTVEPVGLPNVCTPRDALCVGPVDLPDQHRPGYVAGDYQLYGWVNVSTDGSREATIPERDTPTPLFPVILCRPHCQEAIPVDASWNVTFVWQPEAGRATYANSTFHVCEEITRQLGAQTSPDCGPPRRSAPLTTSGL